MGGPGSATAATTNETITSTNVVTDSFNQAFSRVENLSDVGNVSVAVGQPGGGIGGIMPIILLLGMAAILIFFVMKKR